MSRTRRDRSPTLPVAVAALLAVVTTACSDLPETASKAIVPPAADTALLAWPHERIDARCRLPEQPVAMREDGSAILVVWEMPAEEVFEESVLPADPGLLAWRAAIRADSADVLRPIADEPEPASEEEAAMWADERANGELALSGEVGAIEPISCLDALLFAYQNGRVPQLERPTEFLASVLRLESAEGARLAVVFGAGTEMYPPKSVYGFDVVDAYRTAGWRWSYALHNHTTQRNGDRLALGTPTLSTSDVQLLRGLASERGLESARVTNGYYTFSVPSRELGRMRSRDDRSAAGDGSEVN